MTQITEDWIKDRATQNLFEVLIGAGHQAFFVGGCVRNALLGATVADIDISTSARPADVIALVEQNGLRAHPTGIDHGTVTVVANGTPLEITTFRKDVETDGRRAVVAFADAIEDDALRRDFTMNALYADRFGQIVDPLDGLPDLLARRVRFIDDPAQRIKEDYLRILRFFRFHAWYGDPGAGFDADGLAACAANLEGIETLSRERIGAETLKLLSAPDPAPSIAAMEQSGVLQSILPGASAKYLPVLVHFEQAENAPISAIRRLAALGGEDVPSRLRLSKADAKALRLVRQAALEDAPISENAYRIGYDKALSATLVRHALMEQPLPNDYQSALNAGANAVFPIKAADLLDLHGPALGQRLRELEQTWMESGFSFSKSDLLK